MASNKALSATITIGGAVAGSFRSAMASTKVQLGQVGQTVKRLESEQALLTRGITEFGRAGKNIDGLRAKYAAVTASVERLRVAQERLNAVTKAQESNLARRDEIRGKIGGALGMAAGAAVPIGAMVGKSAKFERENQLIGNTAGMKPEEVTKLGTAILQASKDTNQSVEETQGAVGFLVAAGLDAERAQASIRTIGRTATAAGADINDLASASFTLMDSLKIDPKDLQGALDVLAVSGKEGNVELKDMAKVLPVLGSSFVAMKMGGKEAAASMGAALEVARKGAADADEAANNMKNYMAKVMSPETLKKAKKDFNLDLYSIITQAQKTGKNPFEASIVAIQKATKGDQKLIGDLFGDMQVQNFIRPMMQNWDEYNRIKTKALNESAGTTDADFATMMATASEQMKSAQIAAQRFGVTAGGVLAPSVGKASVSLAGFIDGAREFVAAHPALVAGAMKFVVGLTSLRLATLVGGYGFTFLKGAALQTSRVLAGTRVELAMTAAATRAYGAASTVMSGGITGMATRAFPMLLGAIRAVTIGMLTNPIGLLAAGIAVAGVLIYRNWSVVKSFMGGMWTGFLEGIRPAREAVNGLIAAIPGLGAVFTAIGGAIQSVWKWFTDLISPVQATGAQLAAAGSAGQSFGQILGAGIQLALTPLTKMVEMLTWIANTAPKLLDSIKVGAAVDKIKGFFGGKSDAPAPGQVGATAAAGAVLPTPPSSSPAGTAPALPALPAPAGVSPAAAAAGGNVVHDNSQTVIHIKQAPGESADALADRVAKKIEERKGVQNRGAMYDGATQ